MSRKRTEGHPLRLVLCTSLLAMLAILAASCADALGLDGYRDMVTETCQTVSRCFTGYPKCEDHVMEAVDVNGFLVKSEACSANCVALYECLELDGICRAAPGACEVDAECCGFSAGTHACYDGGCCLALGQTCTPPQGSEADPCCGDTGGCDPDNNRCGGVVCEETGLPCLNDFQCCTGRCEPAPNGEGKVCEGQPCPQPGFECQIDEDCCDLICEDGVCTDPAECSLKGEPCNDAVPCCEPLECYDAGKKDGVCNDDDCIPENADCFSHEQCCTGFCDPDYHLCGFCQGDAVGEECSPAVPCCKGFECVNGKCEVDPTR